jgi:hypothetical protein
MGLDALIIQYTTIHTYISTILFDCCKTLNAIPHRLSIGIVVQTATAEDMDFAVICELAVLYS